MLEVISHVYTLHLSPLFLRDRNREESIMFSANLSCYLLNSATGRQARISECVNFRSLVVQQVRFNDYFREIYITNKKLLRHPLPLRVSKQYFAKDFVKSRPTATEIRPVIDFANVRPN